MHSHIDALSYVHAYITYGDANTPALLMSYSSLTHAALHSSCAFLLLYKTIHESAHTFHLVSEQKIAFFIKWVSPVKFAVVYVMVSCMLLYPRVPGPVPVVADATQSHTDR